MTKCVKVQMLDGPAKGEKRKFPYDAVTVVSADSVAKKLAKGPEKSAPPAAPAAQASTQAAPTATGSAEATPEEKDPYAIGKALFGNLQGFRLSDKPGTRH